MDRLKFVVVGPRGNVGNSTELSTFPQAAFFEKILFFSFCSFRCRMSPLELHRRQVSERGMQSPRVVEPLEIVEDHRPRLLAAREAATGCLSINSVSWVAKNLSAIVFS